MRTAMIAAWLGLALAGCAGPPCCPPLDTRFGGPSVADPAARCAILAGDALRVVGHQDTCDCPADCPCRDPEWPTR